MNVAFGSDIASEGLIETNSDRYVFGETSLIPEKGHLSIYELPRHNLSYPALHCFCCRLSRGGVGADIRIFRIGISVNGLSC